MSSLAMTSDAVILVGGFAEVIELSEECRKRIVGLIDPRLRADYRGYSVLGNDDDARDLHQRYPEVPVFVGIDDPARRAALVAIYHQAGFSFTNLVHPRAQVSPSARIGTGVMIQYGACLAADVQVGDHVRVNTYANLTHEVRVGTYSTVAPSAVILGRVRVGECCYVGAHSTILPDLEVGDGARVGAHANVTRPVAPGDTVVGNPARSLSRSS